MENKTKEDLISEVQILTAEEEANRIQKMKDRDDAELDAEFEMLQFVSRVIKKTDTENVLMDLVTNKIIEKIEEDEVSPSLLIELLRDLKVDTNDMVAHILSLYKQKVLIQQNIVNANFDNKEKQLPSIPVDALPSAEKSEVLDAKKAYEIIQTLESLSNKNKEG